MDIIFIKKLLVMAKIGVYDWERDKLQRLILDVELGRDYFQACQTDNIIDCLDYSIIIKEILLIVKKQKFFLIERLAEEISIQLMSKFIISWLRLKIIKLNAVKCPVTVGVMIERTRKFNTY